MPDSIADIVARTETTIELSGWNSWTYDADAVPYIVFPDHQEDFDFIALLRYGNWAGGAFGDKMYAPALDWDAPGLTLAQLDQKLANFHTEDPNTGVYDGFDAHARIHDLLYERANLIAATDYRTFLQTHPDATESERAAERERLNEQQTAGYREADIWWMATRSEFVPSTPYGIVMDHLAAAYFGAMGTAHLLGEGVPLIDGDKLARDLGERFGSHIGSLIAGDNMFEQIVGNRVGGAVGKGIGALITSGDLETSLLAATGAGPSLLEGSLEAALAEFTDQIPDFTIGGLKSLASTLIIEAAEDLDIGEFGTFVVTTTGQDVSNFLIDKLADYTLGNADSFFGAVRSGIESIDVIDYVTTIAIDYLTMDFSEAIVDFAKSIVSIDSEGEALFANIQSIAGSVIGAAIGQVLGGPLGGYLGGKIGETIGHILGSITFETLDFVTGGLLSDWFDEDPVGAFYTKYNPVTEQMEIDHPISDHTWDRNGASNVTLNKLREASEAATDAYLSFVNGIIESIDGTVVLTNFEVVPGNGRLNHAAFGFHDHAFQLMRQNGGDKLHSQDLGKLIRVGIEWELSQLVFHGGDLMQVRALDEWKIERLRKDDANKLVYKDGESVGVLTSYMQIAKDYRTYLDNAETINFLIASAPNSAFALGWMATLLQAAALGLDQPYIDTGDGAVGTAGADKILSADGADVLYGNDGDDVIKAYGGADKVYGGNGADTLDGGGGDDIVLGDVGDDVVHAARATTGSAAGRARTSSTATSAMTRSAARRATTSPGAATGTTSSTATARARAAPTSCTAARARTT